MTETLKAAFLGGVAGAVISAGALIYTNDQNIRARRELAEIEVTLRYKHETYARFTAALDQQVHMALDRDFGANYPPAGKAVKDLFWEVEALLPEDATQEAEKLFDSVHFGMDTFQNGGKDSQIKEKEKALREFLRHHLFSPVEE